MMRALRFVALLAVSSVVVAQSAKETAMSTHPVFELRQYTLHSGKRDTLIDLFERHFIESQEALGMRVPAHFRDLDNPDRFVWFRGFADMAARGAALPAFYLQGAAWKAHRGAANATMLDSDNVLLLREAWPGSGFVSASAPRPPVGAEPASEAVVVVTAYALVNPVDEDFVGFFRDTLAPTAQAAGAKLLATFVSEESGNNFAPLPLRHEHALVWVASFADAAAYRDYRQALEADPRWRDAVEPVLAQRLIWPADARRLAPAARSLVQE